MIRIEIIKSNKLSNSVFVGAKVGVCYLMTKQNQICKVAKPSFFDNTCGYHYLWHDFC